jgi:WD40 repeat protein
VWDLKSGTVKWEVRERRGIRRVAISPDGKLVATGNWGGTIHVRDAVTGKLVKTFDQTGGSIECVAFSTAGHWLASCGNSRKVQIWDLATGQAVRTFEGHTNVPYGVQFSADDKCLLSFGRDRSARLWNVLDGKPLRLYLHPGEVFAAGFLASGKQFFTYGFDGKIRIFDIDSKDPVSTRPFLSPKSPQPGLFEAFVLSPDEKLLAAGDQSKIRVFQMENLQQSQTLEDHSYFTYGLAFSQDASTLISSDASTAVHVWDVPEKKVRRTFELPQAMQQGAGPLRSMSLAPGGRILATASGDNHVELRNRTTGEVLRTLDAQEPVTGVAFSPTGETLATVGGSVQLWNVTRGARTATLTGHTAEIASIAWSPDGKLLATGSADQTVRLWNVTTQQATAVLQGHTAEVQTVAFTPDGQRLVSGSSDSTVRIWDALKGTATDTLTDHVGAVTAVAVAPDGATIASAGEDALVRLWDAATLQLRATMRGHKQPVASLAFSPQSQTLASGGLGGGIMLWDTAQGVSRRTLNGHSDSVAAITFLPNASALLSGSPDQTIRIWRAAPVKSPK